MTYIFLTCNQNNYFTVIKSNDLEDYLVNNFNYIFFPIAYETKLKIKSDNAKIIKCNKRKIWRAP